MQSVIKSSIKTVEEYRHNIKLLKYHLKKEQKLNQTLRYKDAKKHKKQTVTNLISTKQIHPFYNIVQTVNELSRRMKEMGLLLADVFRMTDNNYEGEITKEQFMKTILRLRSNLDQQLINEMFYAVDSNLNGLLSADQYEQFLYAHGGCQSKEAITYQRKAAQKLAALLKKKGIKLSNFLDDTLDPCGAPQLATKLKDLKLNSNQVMILLKLWDPSLTGSVRHAVYSKSMENVKQKDQKQIQNQKFQKGIKQLCVILRDKKLNPITIFEQAQSDGKAGITPFELQQGLKRIIPSQTPFQIRKWVNLINLNNDQQITKQEFISAVRSFYSIQQINNFGAQYQKMHPTLKKALAEDDLPAQKIINQLSIAIQDSGFTKTQVFRRIDINHNGLVDKEQLLEGLKHMGINVGLIAKVLTVFDRDASGEVALDQWLSILGEDLQMQDVQQAPKLHQNKKQQKGVIKPKQIKKSVEKKNENNMSNQKKNEPLKDKDKNKKTEESVKKSTKKAVPQPTKQKQKQDQMIKLSKNILKSRLPKVQSKKFQSQHEQEKQIQVQSLQRQIVGRYSVSKLKVLQSFKAATKNTKKGITLQQFQKCIKQMKLREEDDNKSKKIYEDNISSGGKFDYQEWLNSLPEKYDIQVQNHSEKEQQNQKIPESQSRKELPNESYVEDYDNNFQNQSLVKQPAIKRGQNKEDFQEVKKLVVQNQLHTQEGYKFSTYIGTEEQLQLLNKVYLPNANKLKQKKAIFKDKLFPTERSSLTDSPSSSKIQNVTLLKWKHYSELYKSPKLFQKGIEPNDIVQGQLGDCYFLCSLAGLAEYHRLIQRLFEYYDIENGYFLIWLCLDGKWKLMQLDGYIPVKPDGKAVVFSRGRAGDEQLWVLLLQKAYAKAYGCYEHIVGGQPYEAIKDLSGAPGQSFNHKNKNINPDFIWQKLKYANEMQFIMTCGTDQSDKGQFKLDDHSESVTTQGIVIGHAYSILDLAVYRGEKLIQLRNPWGTMEWNGPWSDKSKIWTVDARAALKYTSSKDDGIFWMPFETYFKYYATTAINYLQPNYYYTSQRKLKVKHLVMKIEPGSLNHGFVMIAQEDHRKKGLPSNTPYNVCHIIALSCKDGKVFKKISDQKYLYQREGSVEISDIDSKSEIVILINLQNTTDFNLCSYANTKVSYELDENYDSLYQYIESIAQLEQNAKNVQTDQKNTFKSWLTSVGDYAFLVFKNITKKELNITIQLQKPSNLKLLESSTTKKMKIQPNCCQTIKGKINDAKQPYSFGPMSIIS